MITYSDILKRTGLKDTDIIAAYSYGSRVYGNITAKSDYDYIIIVKTKTCEQFSDNLININFFDEPGHKTRILNHEISALETLFLSPEFILKETYKFGFKLDLSALRQSCSAKSSNSWVKSKKKLTIPVDYDLAVGRKSLWHAIRIIDFATQIAKTGKIEDYASCNDLYWEIMENHFDWDSLFETYKEYYNRILTEFRKVAPK
jgi:predicted nucleotidyltransferase